MRGLLATLDPAAGQRRAAYALGLLMICGFVLTVPLFRSHVASVPAITVVVDTTFTLLAALVAVLLLAQFKSPGHAPLLPLGCGFLLVSLTTLPQLLRAVQGLLPDGRLAFVTQLALPGAVLVYAAMARTRREPALRGMGAGAQL